MGLCHECENITFKNLPPFPACSFSSGLHDKGLAVLFDRENVDAPCEELGLLWHENLHALRNSTSNSGCNLCALAYAGTEDWIRRYEAEIQRNHWIGGHHSTDKVLFENGIWLTQRYGGGDGFVVLASIIESSMHGFTILAGISLGVDAATRQATQLVIPMALDSSDRASLDTASLWLDECNNHHKDCPTPENPYLPSRILDIGTQGGTIRLIDGISAQREKYATLSYCWGRGVTPARTTRNTLQTNQAGILIRSLPKTFRDAITISRHLGIVHLWIDSLCIIQDDKGDWIRESSRMTEIYSKAYVMIAANRAKDCDQGCFHVRSSMPSTKLVASIQQETYAQLLKLEMEHSQGIDFRAQPLSMRGWALQERVLANRIVHYNDDQMYFECRRGVQGENGSFLPYRYCELDVLDETSDSIENKASIRAAWDGIVSTYGRRKLTRPTDKLPALSGLAGMFSRNLGEPYIAGLWAGDLIMSLSWQVPTTIPLPDSDEYAGPSWSWAGFAGPASTGKRSGWTDIARVVDWDVKLRNATSPFGEITAASLRIEAPFIKLRYSSVADVEHEARLARGNKVPLPRMVTGYSDNKYGHIVGLDYRERAVIYASKSWDMHLLLLGMMVQPRVAAPTRSRGSPKQSYQDERNTDTTFFGLVLIPADAACLTMKRVGIMPWVDTDSEGRRMVEDRSCKQIINLV